MTYIPSNSPLRYRNPDGCLTVIGVAAVVFAILLGLLFLTGCRTVQPAAPAVQKKDSIQVRTEVRIDSVFRDRWHTVLQKGDTVFVHDSVFLTRYKMLDRCDTLRVRDSVPYPVEVIREVRHRNGYDRFVSWGFWILLALTVLVTVVSRWFHSGFTMVSQ